ncbi:hypoxanthine phosphoribosyltransferase [Algoriphagus sanaruensis]|uniref:Hypoxanthine phosphoribosyltransferase n=1 Tax=Algoriphagus sanaruensis TaxID=1727163 RepID=A0A142EIF0_9BACT|nr:hypoxanthine phosphoribosyltransferase [Algoriphagus sanaruensis]AMQ54905.1 hypoxanthine phosphoribosyltransferase [Algoriphagus sanaruensis]
MSKVSILDKTFEIYLSNTQIQERINQIGRAISDEFHGDELIIVGVLNGSFLFMADLVRRIELNFVCDFIKVSSYQGTESTGQVKSLLGLKESIEGKSVLIIEDIVDSGLSMEYLLKELSSHRPKRLAIATLLFKREAFRHKYAIDYVGFEIPNKFVVGYGLDYDGLGRNLPHIYQLTTP